MVTGYGPPRVLFTILAMVPPSKSQMGYENPSEGAVRIAAGHLATRIRASDSEVKPVVLLPGSVLHTSCTSGQGRSIAVRKLTGGTAFSFIRKRSDAVCVSPCCIASHSIDEGARAAEAIDV